VRQGPPSTAFREDVQNRAEHVVQVKLPGLRLFARRFQQGAYQLELFPHYVAGIWASSRLFHVAGVILTSFGGYLKDVKQALRQSLRDGYMRYEFIYQRKDGTPIPTEEIMSRITVDGKDLVISYSRNLRAEYAAREAEQAAQKKLQAMTDRLNGQMETQSSAITESSAAIEQMVANTRSVSNTISKNAQNVQGLQEAAEVGHSGLNEVVTDIKEIARESESLLEINSVMQNIASQTNLLSMNAAIEAAHAGESGRGFAVVADEIRKLAESSSQQSKTIGGVLKKIKGSIDKITKSTDNVMNKFEAIDGGVKTVAEQEHGILNAMEEQSTGSTQIMQAIAQVNDITGQVKEDARQMVEAAAKLGV